nr:hypothetical protein [Campylobacter lari]
YRFYSRWKHTLASISGSNETLIYIIVCMILCIGFKNSIEKTNVMKPNVFYILVVIFFLYTSIFILGVIPYTEFIYFNF